MVLREDGSEPGAACVSVQDTLHVCDFTHEALAYLALLNWQLVWAIRTACLQVMHTHWLLHGCVGLYI